MRTLVRNKLPFWMAQSLGTKPIFDEYGNETGEYETEYGKPTKGFANISAANGAVQAEQFGAVENYDKVLVIPDLDVKLDSRFWIDTVPELESDGTLVLEDGVPKTSHDYVVKKIGESLNHVSVALSKVRVDG